MDYPRVLMEESLLKGENATSHVDVMGLLLAVMVHSASIQERKGFNLLSFRIRHRFPNLKIIWVDGGYDGQPLKVWVQRWFNWIVETIHSNQDPLGFEVLPKRWVVERTFGRTGRGTKFRALKSVWFGRYRRLSKDYEYLPTTSETMIYIAMINFMLRRLTWSSSSQVST
ncbi:MAG: transposase [Xenococcus sp. MO_188.B8]|nr:transposase [Xenococcus sp. MO_188.B8]